MTARKRTASAAQHERSYRERRKAAGDRLVAVWMTPQMQQDIAAIKALTPDDPQSTESVIAGAVSAMAPST